MATLTPINAASPLNASDDSRASFTGGTTETLSFALNDIADSLFNNMDTASWTLEYRQQGRSDDTLSLGIRIVNGGTILAAANSGGTFATVNSNVTNTTDTTTGPTAFAYVNTTANKTTWDGASVELQQTYSQNMSPDNAQIQVDYFQLTGTYTQGAVPVTPNEATHLHVADSPAVTQTHNIAPDEAIHLHIADSPVVSQTHEVAPESAFHLHVADAPSTTITHVIAPQEAAHDHVTDSPAVTQVHDLVVDETAHLHITDSPTVTQVHDVQPAEASHEHTVDSPVVTITSIINPDEATHLHFADSPTVNQIYKVLQIRTNGNFESANFTEEAVGGKLMVLDKDNGVTVRGELVEGAVVKLDGTNNQVIAVEFIEV